MNDKKQTTTWKMRLLLLCVGVVATVFLRQMSNRLADVGAQQSADAHSETQEQAVRELLDLASAPVVETKPPTRPPAPEPVVVDIPFEMPMVEHEHATELLTIVHGVSDEYLFPQFSSPEELDYAHTTILSNLFEKALQQRDELAALGYGIPAEDMEKYALYAGENGVLVWRDAMNYLGRQYFGHAFEIPPGTEGRERGVLPQNAQYYWNTAGRCKMEPFRYLMTDIREDGEALEATFLPYKAELPMGPVEMSVTSVLFLDPSTQQFVGRTEWGYIDEERAAGTPILPNNVLDFYRLTVPQENLGTITVRFVREEGRFVAQSCVYNCT